MTLNLRTSVKLAAAILVLTASFQIAGAQDAQLDPVRIIVPCPAGSPADVSARTFFQGLGEEGSLSFSIENSSSYPSTSQAASDLLALPNLVLFDLADCDQPLMSPMVD